MDGIVLTPLRRIAHPKGDVLHALKAQEPVFNGFGEAYFTTINYRMVKGWKMHRLMTMNLVVPLGHVRFHIRNLNGEACSYEIGTANYMRLTISPNRWVAFEGLADPSSLILNVGDLEHDPYEALNEPLEKFPL